MARKPRKLTDRVIDGQMWGDIIFIGIDHGRRHADWHGHAPRRRLCSPTVPWMLSDMMRK